MIKGLCFSVYCMGYTCDYKTWFRSTLQNVKGSHKMKLGGAVRRSATVFSPIHLMMLCPCHSGRPYSTCCQPYHNGQAPATAEALMRSRYAAYASGKVGYIIQTTHPDSPLPPHNEVVWRKELQQFCRGTQFVGLQIMATEEIDRQTATVTFRAVLFQGGRDASFTERSLFARLRGRWFYVRPMTEAE